MDAVDLSLQFYLHSTLQRDVRWSKAVFNILQTYKENNSSGRSFYLTPILVVIRGWGYQF